MRMVQETLVIANQKTSSDDVWCFQCEPSAKPACVNSISNLNLYWEVWKNLSLLSLITCVSILSIWAISRLSDFYFF